MSFLYQNEGEQKWLEHGRKLTPLQALQFLKQQPFATGKSASKPIYLDWTICML